MILDGAKFDDKFETRDGNIAIYHTLVNERPQCLVKGVGLIMYTFAGVSFNSGLEEYYKSGCFPESVDSYELNQFSNLDIIKKL